MGPMSDITRSSPDAATSSAQQPRRRHRRNVLSSPKIPAGVLTLLIALTLTTHWTTPALAQKGSHHNAEKEKNETAAANDTAPAAPAPPPPPPPPLSIPTFLQCERAVINASAQVDPELNAHNLNVGVNLANGTEWFIETVRGAGKNADPTPYVWTWDAVDLEAGTSFVLSVNQSSIIADSKKKNKKDKEGRELVILASTTFVVGPSPSNDTVCLQEAASTNHKGRRQREEQRGQNEVRVIVAVIGSVVLLLLLLIGFMALRRRREAKKRDAAGGAAQEDYDDDLDDFGGHGAARLTESRGGASELSLQNPQYHSSATNAWGAPPMRGGAGGAGGGAGAEDQSPFGRPSADQGLPRRNMERAAGYKYMSRMVGGLLDFDPTPTDPAATSHSNLVHRAAQHEDGRPNARRTGSNGSANENSVGNNPFASRNDATYLHQGGEEDDMVSRSAIPLQRIAGHHNGNTAAATAVGEDALPSYRDSTAERRRSGKSRLGADGRIQEGVVVRARPPQYQHDWSADGSTASAAGSVWTNNGGAGGGGGQQEYAAGSGRGPPSQQQHGSRLELDYGKPPYGQAGPLTPDFEITSGPFRQ
ncbi:hypothetical protein V8E36_008920 [Tilletia maclaganii]